MSIKDKIKGELDCMEQTGVMATQTEPMIIQDTKQFSIYFIWNFDLKIFVNKTC